MALTNKQKITSVGEDVGKLEPVCSVCSWDVNRYGDFVKQYGVRHYKRNTSFNNSTFGYLPQRNKLSILKRYLHSMFITALFAITKEVGTTQMSTDEWMHQKNVLYRHQGILCIKKEEDSDMCYKMNEPWRNYAKWDKPVKKDKFDTIPLIS